MTTAATVIVYHGLGDCPAAQDPYRMFMPIAKFARHMEFLARHRRVVPLDDIVAGRAGRGRPAVAVTFDDGYCSVLEEAVPILQRFGFPATCFVPTRWIGAANGWDTFGPTDRPLPILSAAGLVELEAAGVKVESHGHAHIPLGEVDEQDANADISASRKVLADVLGREARFLAYPYGSQSRTAQKAVESCGFECAFSIGQRDEGRFGRERVTIRPADNLALYAFKTSGRYLAMRESRWGDGAFGLIRPVVHARRARGGVKQPSPEGAGAAMTVAMFVHVLDDRAVSRVVGVLGHEIVARGVEVVVVCASSTEAGRARLPHEIPLVDLGLDAERKTSQAVPALVRWLRRARPRVLFAHGEGPARAAVMARLLARVSTAVVIVEHTHGRTFRRPSRARAAAVQFLYPRAALVTGVAPAVVEDLEQLVPKLRGRTAVLPSVGPDPSELSDRVAAPAEHPWFGGDTRPYVIVCVANIVARKGQDVLVRALPAIRAAVGDARLLLIGRIDEPDFAAELRRLAADSDVADCVCLVGYRDDPLPLVARSQIGTLASKTEGLPMSLLEAMTCGLPVVSTDCPAGPAYLLEQGTSGLLVPVDDADAMADAVIRIARDDDLRASLIARGRERAAAFSPAAVASRYLEVATQVALPSHGARRRRGRG